MWRYIGNTFLLSLMVMIPVAIVGVPVFRVLAYCCLPFPYFNVTHSWGAIVFGFVVLVTAFLVLSAIMYRLAIKLPAVATGRRDFTFGNALNASIFNFKYIMAFALLLTLSIAVPQFLIAKLSVSLTDLLGVSGTILGSVLSMSFQWLSLIVGVSALTSLYGFFVEKRDF